MIRCLSEKDTMVSVLRNECEKSEKKSWENKQSHKTDRKSHRGENPKNITPRGRRVQDPKERRTQQRPAGHEQINPRHLSRPSRGGSIPCVTLSPAPPIAPPRQQAHEAKCSPRGNRQDPRRKSGSSNSAGGLGPLGRLLIQTAVPLLSLNSLPSASRDGCALSAKTKVVPEFDNHIQEALQLRLTVLEYYFKIVFK